MFSVTRISITTKLLACLVSLACALLLVVGGAAGAQATVSYQKESYAEYQQQLSAGQIESVTINKRLRSLRVKLKDGTYVLAKYGRHEEPKVASALAAKHVAVTILKPAEAAREAKAAPKHHKLRYIAGGILIAVVVIVAAVLLIDRRRKSARD